MLDGSGGCKAATNRALSRRFHVPSSQSNFSGFDTLAPAAIR